MCPCENIYNIARLFKLPAYTMHCFAQVAQVLKRAAKIDCVPVQRERERDEQAKLPTKCKAKHNEWANEQASNQTNKQAIKITRKQTNTR